jgi:hypothetical protein
LAGSIVEEEEEEEEEEEAIIDLSTEGAAAPPDMGSCICVTCILLLIRTSALWKDIGKRRRILVSSMESYRKDTRACILLLI